MLCPSVVTAGDLGLRDVLWLRCRRHRFLRSVGEVGRPAVREGAVGQVRGLGDLHGAHLTGASFAKAHPRVRAFL